MVHILDSIRNFYSAYLHLWRRVFSRVRFVRDGRAHGILFLPSGDGESHPSPLLTEWARSMEIPPRTANSRDCSRPLSIGAPRLISEHASHASSHRILDAEVSGTPLETCQLNISRVRAHYACSASDTDTRSDRACCRACESS